METFLNSPSVIRVQYQIADPRTGEWVELSAFLKEWVEEKTRKFKSELAVSKDAQMPVALIFGPTTMRKIVVPKHSKLTTVKDKFSKDENAIGQKNPQGVHQEGTGENSEEAGKETLQID